MSLEDELTQAMEAMYRRAGEQAGYWGNYFLRDVRAKGGLATAKRLLRPQSGGGNSKGFQALIDARRTDLSLEQLVLNSEYRRLFTPVEQAEARRRLDSVPLSARRGRVRSEAIDPDVLPPNVKYPEGAKRRIVVNAYERSERARKACIAHHGRTCVVCGIDFGKVYGDLGEGFIHVHHMRPLAMTRKAYRVDPVKDLIPVCPNCHAMLHATTPPQDFEELREIVQRRARKTL
jgi:5-methylcytosine-specific restriction enzyme A